MHFGFSYTGLIMLMMLFVPNFFWTKNKSSGYDQYVYGENKILLVLERTGGSVCQYTLSYLFKF